MLRKYSSIFLISIIAGCHISPEVADSGEGQVKFEIQGFSIDFSEDKKSYGTYVSYEGRGSVVVSSPDAAKNKSFIVWLKVRETCGKKVNEKVMAAILINGIGDIETHCSGSVSAGDNSSNDGDAPRQAPNYEWPETIAYQELESSAISVRK